MNDELLKTFAEGAQAWLKENKDSEQPDTVGQELLEELEPWVSAGVIQVEPTNEYCFSMIEGCYPVSVNRIDWSKVKNHQVAEFRPSRIEQVECEVLRERLHGFKPQLEGWLNELGVSISEIVAFVGDGSEITLKMPVSVFLECYPILLEQPQHGYLLPLDGKWCLSYTIESELFIGESKNAVAKGWVEE